MFIFVLKLMQNKNVKHENYNFIVNIEEMKCLKIF